MVKKKKKKKSSYSGKVSSTAREQKSAGANYGYLKLPKDVDVFSLDSKKVYLDIMSYIVTDKHHLDRNEENDRAMVGNEWYKKPFKVHRSIGVDNDSYVCLSTIGKKCPICEYRASLLKEHGKTEETDALKPSDRNLYFVRPKQTKKYEDKLHVWDISRFLFQNLFNDELDENEEYEAFADNEIGHTLKIRSEEKSYQKSKFYNVTRIDFEDREEQYDENELEETPSLDDILNVLTYKELKTIFFEMSDDDEDDDDDEDEAPKRKKKKVSKKKPVVEDNEDDDEDDDDEDDDQCPKCKGTGKYKGKKCKACDGTGVIPSEDDDEDEDDDEEEEEEKPKRKKKVIKKGNKKKPSKKNKCPHGHRFGVDADDFDECNECKKWDDCTDEKES